MAHGVFGLQLKRNPVPSGSLKIPLWLAESIEDRLVANLEESGNIRARDQLFNPAMTA